MKLLLSLVMVVTFSGIVWAQGRPSMRDIQISDASMGGTDVFTYATGTVQQKDAKPASPQPDTSQQKLLKEALAATDKATNELALAQAKADAARAKFFALLANVQAELSLKPSEWTVRLSPDGDIGFERIVAAKADSKPTGASKP